MKYRKNLSESLEQYAKRFEPPLPPDKVRVTWRLQGLRFLGVVPWNTPFEDLVPLVDRSVPIVAPGLPCPTKSVFGDAEQDR